MDNLSLLLQPHAYQTRVFYDNHFCGISSFDDDVEKCGHLHIVRSGRATLHHQRQPTLEVAGPALVFYPRGLTHQLHVARGDSTLLLCARVQFGVSNGLALALALPELVHVAPDQVVGLPATLALLYQHADQQYAGRAQVLDRLCDVVVTQLIQHLYASGSLDADKLTGQPDNGLLRVLELMHSDAGQPWTLQQLADLAGMSRSKFARVFHEVVGHTPADYLAEQRMLLAQTLLKELHPVKAVADKVGYASQSAFTKAFSARRGMSPRAWLQSLRG